MYDDKKKSYIRIFDFKSACEGKNEPLKEIQGPDEHLVNQVSWGPLNKTLYIATDKGKLILHDIETNTALVDKVVHKGEIFSFTVTYDHTMLATCAKDGLCILMDPYTFEPIRTFPFEKPCRAAAISPLYENPEL